MIYNINVVRDFYRFYEKLKIEGKVFLLNYRSFRRIDVIFYTDRINEEKINKYEYFKPYFKNLKTYSPRSNLALFLSSAYLYFYSKGGCKLYHFMLGDILPLRSCKIFLQEIRGSHSLSHAKENCEAKDDFLFN